MRKTDTYSLIQNKLHWHIYRLLHSCTVSEKLVKIPLFGPSLIHQLRLLGSQHPPQSGVLLIPFSTWGTENSLVEINLESTRGGGIKGCNIFWFKIWQTLAALWENALYCNKKKLKSRTQLDEPAECASGGDPLLLYKILHLLFFPLV